MITANQIIVHLVGDYVLQSDWMATEKTTKSIPALVHVLIYTISFLLLTSSWQALFIIASTHYVIDRWRLVRYLIWLKNFIAPLGSKRFKWSECTGTGYHDSRPLWLSVWLMILVDNILHLILNGMAIKWF